MIMNKKMAAKVIWHENGKFHLAKIFHIFNILILQNLGFRTSSNK